MDSFHNQCDAQSEQHKIVCTSMRLHYYDSIESVLVRSTRLIQNCHRIASCLIYTYNLQYWSDSWQWTRVWPAFPETRLTRSQASAPCTSGRLNYFQICRRKECEELCEGQTSCRFVQEQDGGTGNKPTSYTQSTTFSSRNSSHTHTSHHVPSNLQYQTDIIILGDSRRWVPQMHSSDWNFGWRLGCPILKNYRKNFLGSNLRLKEYALRAHKHVRNCLMNVHLDVENSCSVEYARKLFLGHSNIVPCFEAGRLGNLRTVEALKKIRARSHSRCIPWCSWPWWAPLSLKLTPFVAFSVPE